VVSHVCDTCKRPMLYFLPAEDDGINCACHLKEKAP